MHALKHFDLNKVLTNSLSIRVRICLSAVSILLVMAAYFFYALYSQQELANLTREIMEVRINAMRSAENIKHSLVSHDNTIFRFLATANQDELRERKQLQDLSIIEMNRLRLFSESAVIQSRLRLLQAESEQYFSEADRLLKFWQKNNLPENAGLFKAIAWARGRSSHRQELILLSVEGRTRLAKVFSVCDELVTLNRVSLEQSQNEMHEALQQSRRTVLLVGVTAGGIILIISIGLAFSLLTPLGALLEGVQRVRQGDLGFEIPVASSDELGQLTNAFNQMTQTVRSQHEQLLRETITDSLTGIYNQKHFRNVLKHELDRARRSKRPVSLIMFDIDHFKQYNDTNGHEFGNEVLKIVCSTVKESLREIDILARYGGDELVAILPETNREESQDLLKRLEDAVADCSFQGEGNFPKRKITLSIGGASFPENARSTDELIVKADQALYAAKAAGRNCFRWAE